MRPNLSEVEKGGNRRFLEQVADGQTGEFFANRLRVPTTAILGNDHLADPVQSSLLPHRFEGLTQEMRPTTGWYDDGYHDAMSRKARLQPPRVNCLFQGIIVRVGTFNIVNHNGSIGGKRASKNLA